MRNKGGDVLADGGLKRVNKQAIILFILTIVLILAGCSRKEPIKIGLAAE